MDALTNMIGRETDLRKVSAMLRERAVQFGPNVIGAHHVVCSDESEVECVEVFQEEFVTPLLPNLGPDKKAAFRTSNLGARYELCSSHIAEHHYATPESRLSAKCVVIKINGHVSETATLDGRVFGPMERYEAESNACGALHALLAGVDAPFTDELRQAFVTEELDRVAALCDSRRVDPSYRYLIAAMVSARLQAGRAADDVRDHSEFTPTVYLIVPCITLNRPGPDGEIVCGYYIADYRGIEPHDEYHGLGDDPTSYRVEDGDDGLYITNV